MRAGGSAPWLVWPRIGLVRAGGAAPVLAPVVGHRGVVGRVHGGGIEGLEDVGGPGGGAWACWLVESGGVWQRRGLVTGTGGVDSGFFWRRNRRVPIECQGLAFLHIQGNSSNSYKDT